MTSPLHWELIFKLVSLTLLFLQNSYSTLKRHKQLTQFHIITLKRLDITLILRLLQKYDIYVQKRNLKRTREKHLNTVLE